ncbi:DUF5946 family protein [Candidatus Zixiibacteriota bacterium]
MVSEGITAFETPRNQGNLTVFDVALAESSGDHAVLVRTWTESVWSAWSDHPAGVSQLVSQYL